RRSSVLARRRLPRRLLPPQRGGRCPKGRWGQVLRDCPFEAPGKRAKALRGAISARPPPSPAARGLPPRAGEEGPGSARICQLSHLPCIMRGSVRPPCARGPVGPV